MPHNPIMHKDDFLIGAVHTGLDLGVDDTRTCQEAKRIISGLEDFPTFDELIVEVKPPHGFVRTQGGLLMPESPGSE